MTGRQVTVIDRAKAVMPVVLTVTLVIVFAGTTVCSLVMSANATMTYATAHHMPAAIQWTPVGILELVQVAGTAWWLISDGWSRLGAVALVAGTASVTLVMSCSLYGWVGCIAPVGMVATIHAIACIIRAATKPRALQEVPRLDGWTKAAARARARELGVGQAGTVADIVERIREAEGMTA